MRERRRNLIYTHEPTRKVWDHLCVLTSSHDVKRLLTGQMDSGRGPTSAEQELVETKASHIARCISQAFEYYRAADYVSVSTSPVLYFYGMLCLVRALVLANDPKVLPADIRYHGLHTKPVGDALKAYCEDERSWRIEKEFAVTKGGVFKHLTRVVQQFEFPDETVIYFKDLLAVSPEVAQLYPKYYGEFPAVCHLGDGYFENNDDGYVLHLAPEGVGKDAFEAAFPEVPRDFDLQAPSADGEEVLDYRSKSHVASRPPYIGIYRSVAGARYLVGSLTYALKGGDRARRYVVPEISAYVLMFILSICVRYKPDFWGKVIQGAGQGGFGLINLVTSVARTAFPNFILNELFNEDFRFGPRDLDW